MTTRGFDLSGTPIAVPVYEETTGKETVYRIKKEDCTGLSRLDILPELSASMDGEEGCFIVPFWHNGMISKFRPVDRPSDRCQPCMYFYGIQKKERTLLAIIEGMRFEALTYLTYENGRHEVFFSLPLDEDGIDVYEDVTLRVITLPAGSDYNDVAKKYRAYKLTGGMKTLKEKKNAFIDRMATGMEIRVRMAWKPVPSPEKEQTNENEPPLHVAVTFDKLMDLMREMKRAGIEKAELCLVGWNVSGHDGRYPQLFPVEPKLGGEKKLREAIALAEELGYGIVCHTNSTDAYSIADCFDLADMIRKKDQTVSTNERGWSGGRMYHLSSRKALENAQKNLPEVRALGFAGVHYIDVLSIIRPYYDHTPGRVTNRRETVENFRKIVEIARGQFGGIGSEGGFETLADRLDFCLYTGFNMFTKAPEGFADELVPLWQLVFHGCAVACPSSELVNIGLNGQGKRLKFLEYGGYPAMYIHSRFVTETKDRGNWMGDDDLRLNDGEQLARTVRVLKETEDFCKPFAPLQYEFLEEHKRLSETLVRLTYADGHRLYINYGADEASADGVTVPKENYLLI